MPRSEAGALRLVLTALAAVALLFGLYGRFKGLGVAPLSVDEYYLVRSIDDVLRTGLPAFDCGGLYTRGLLLQYSAAGLRLAGLTPELAPRLVAACSGLLVLPAAWQLGRRLYGREVGLLAVLLLAASVWEIELARFGRMYAPFQPLCLWYLVYFLRYAVDGEARALWPMLLLSALAPLVWEGGALLPLLNVLPVCLRRAPAFRFERRDFLFLSAAAALFALAFWFIQHDFRGVTADALPPGFSRGVTVAQVDPVATLAPPWQRLPAHPVWLILALLPLGLLVAALRALFVARFAPFAMLALLAVLGAASLHQFALAAGIVVIALLARAITWEELWGSGARAVRRALAVLLLFWLVFGAATTPWGSNESLARTLAAYGYRYLAFPDFIGVVMRPWIHAVPILFVLLFVPLAVALWRQCRRSDAPADERALLLAVMVMLLAACASHPPREETRYIFFLFPPLVLVALGTLQRGLLRVSSAPLASWATAAVALAGFAISEDFQPRHVLAVDQPIEVFRRRMNLDLQGHLELRTDYRGMAAWLQQRVGPGDAVINGVHGLDYYYPRIDAFFVDERDPDMPDWSCRHGTIERWGNYPMVYTVSALQERVQRSRTTYLIAYLDNNPNLLNVLAAYSPRILRSEGYISVIELQGSGLNPAG